MRALWLSIIAALAITITSADARASEAPPDPPGTIGKISGAPVRIVAPLSVGGLNLVTKSVEAGAFTGGLGLGIDLAGGAVSPALAVAASAASKDTNYANIAGLVGIFRVAWVGAMLHVEPSFQQWTLLAGIDPIALTGVFRPGP